MTTGEDSRATKEASDNERNELGYVEADDYLLMLLKKAAGAWGKAQGGEKWMIAFTGVIMVVNGIYAVLGLLQWNAMRDQLNQMKTSSSLDSRAWVGVKGGTPSRMSFALGGQPTCRVQFTNTGQSPAMDVSIQHSIWPNSPSADIEAMAMPLENRSKYPAKSVGAVPPNSVIAVDSRCNGLLSLKSCEDISEGRVVIYVFGRVSYYDVFGVEHKTRYCFTIDPNTYELKPYTQYNYMD